MPICLTRHLARTFARRALPIAALSAVLAIPALAADNTITISSWGGNYQEAISKAIWQPTAKELGITILEDSTNGLADVRAQVTANSVLWDITELTIDGCAQGQTEGLFENIDYKQVKSDGFDPVVVQPTYIAFNYYSNVIGWSTAKFGDAGPQSWADFWNAEKFPGRRSLRNDPAEVLEAALLADGVEPAKLYPLDLDRAFKSLEKIKPHISVWWSSGAQAAQLVADGEVDMIGAWNGRISAAIASGAKYKFTFNQGLLIADCLAIPKGVKNKDLATKALAKAVSPEILANIPQYIDYGPANLKSYETGKIPPELAKTLNTAPENAAKQAIVRGDWWGQHGQEARDRWAKFINQ